MMQVFMYSSLYMYGIQDIFDIKFSFLQTAVHDAYKQLVEEDDYAAWQTKLGDNKLKYLILFLMNFIIFCVSTWLCKSATNMLHVYSVTN